VYLSQSYVKPHDILICSENNKDILPYFRKDWNKDLRGVYCPGFTVSARASIIEVIFRCILCGIAVQDESLK